MSGPWSFQQARDACRQASAAQKQAEHAVEQAHRAAAKAEQDYRVALAKEITRLHSQEGVAWSSTADLARGDEAVARLKLERDIAVGVREALAQAVWRATADRKDAQRFSDWSMRVETVTATQDDSRLAWSRQAA